MRLQNKDNYSAGRIAVGANKIPKFVIEEENCLLRVALHSKEATRLFFMRFSLLISPTRHHFILTS